MFCGQPICEISAECFITCLTFVFQNFITFFGCVVTVMSRSRDLADYGCRLPYNQTLRRWSVVMTKRRSAPSRTQPKRKEPGSTRSLTEEPQQSTPATATTRFNPTPSNTAIEQQVQQSLEPLPTTSLIGSAEKSEVVMPVGGQSFLY